MNGRDSLQRQRDGEAAVLDRARAHALAFLAGLDTRSVAATATAEELRDRLSGPLPLTPTDQIAVIDRLVRDVDGGLLGSTAGRFFGWVIGGTLPVAVAADWLTSVWDQNAASYALSPAEAVVEEVSGAWLKELLGLPAAASFALVTGTQIAHVTALAAARHRLLERRGIDVETEGLAGTPPIRVLAGALRHESLLRALRLIGIGTAAVEAVPCDADGRMSIAGLADALSRDRDRPTIVCLQAGDVNSGAYDPFGPACDVAHEAGAWVHVDGAFGLWAAVSDRRRSLLTGVEKADSWATDGHKLLNLPYDIGFVFVADASAHAGAFAQSTSFGVLVDNTRRQLSWNPEWSRRGRGFSVYAAIRALGREGIAAMVDRCCDLATALVEGLGTLPGAEIMARPVLNQGLIRFRAADGGHDAWTDAVAAAVQASGTAWFGSTSWQGNRAMRVSVCNWRTTEADVAVAIAAVKAAIATADRPPPVRRDAPPR